MKRLLAIGLICAILLGLAGCQRSVPKLEDPSYAPLTMTPGETQSSYNGIDVRIDSLNWHEEEAKTTMVVVWDNDSNYDVMYGAAYEIERLEEFISFTNIIASGRLGGHTGLEEHSW